MESPTASTCVKIILHAIDAPDTLVDIHTELDRLRPAERRHRAEEPARRRLEGVRFGAAGGALQSMNDPQLAIAVQALTQRGALDFLLPLLAMLCADVGQALYVATGAFVWDAMHALGAAVAAGALAWATWADGAHATSTASYVCWAVAVGAVTSRVRPARPQKTHRRRLTPCSRCARTLSRWAPGSNVRPCRFLLTIPLCNSIIAITTRRC